MGRRVRSGGGGSPGLTFPLFSAHLTKDADSDSHCAIDLTDGPGLVLVGAKPGRFRSFSVGTYSETGGLFGDSYLVGETT
jgi:hypothetical protein